MSKLAAAVSALVGRLGSQESRLDALTARVAALEAQLATATATTADAGIELVPIRDEAAIALAEYRRQLEDVEFNPEADGVTSAMRAEHRAAVDAMDRAASWIERSGKTRDKEIYAAVGAGRKALIRLAAMRERRPVPMPLLTADELSGYVNAATDVHTEDRFRWEGTGNAEFLLDRPEFGKPVVVEVVPVGKFRGYLRITQVQRTDRSLKDADKETLDNPDEVFCQVVDPEITHLRIEAVMSWRARVIQFDELPPLDDETTTGRGEALFRHTPRVKKVTIQGTLGGRVLYVPDCNCTDTCTVWSHLHFKSLGSIGEGDFREDVSLFAETGMLYMKMQSSSVWSITVLDH